MNRLSGLPADPAPALAAMRMVALAAFTAGVGLAQDLSLLGLCVATAGLAALGMVGHGGLSGRVVNARLLAAAVFVLLFGLLVLLPPVLAGGNTSAATTWVVQAALRLVAVVLMASALMAGLGPLGVAQGLMFLRLPPRFVRLVVLTLRYIPLLQQTHLRQWRAAQARGLEQPHRKGFKAWLGMDRWRHAGLHIGRLLVHAHRRSERVAVAMQARGFTGAARRQASRSSASSARTR